MQDIFTGVDVAKDWLDIHDPVGGPWRIENTPRSVRAFAQRSARQGAWIIFGASGGYDRLLREALEAFDVRFSRVNPRQARDFARAMGVIGKTDRVDARLLSEFGVRLRPARTLPLAPARRALQAQATRRRQLVELRKKEATRLQQTSDADARADIRSLIAILDRRIARVETRMSEIIASDPEMAAQDRRLRTVPGVGEIVAATLIAELPELGRIDRRQIAALAGLAPIARQRQAHRPAHHRRRATRRQNDVVYRRPTCLTSVRGIQGVPESLGDRRQTRQGCHHSHRAKAPRRPQRHAGQGGRLLRCCGGLNTVAGKPGAVQSPRPRPHRAQPVEPPQSDES